MPWKQKERERERYMTPVLCVYLRVLPGSKVSQDCRHETRWARLEDGDDEHGVSVDVLQHPFLEARG